MMKRYLALTVLFLLITQLSWSQKLFYPVAQIPDSLIDNAKAIIRENIISIELEALDCIKIYEKKAITIMDKSGDKHAQGYFNYSKLNSISSISAAIFNDSGDRIKTYARKDFKDISYDSYGTLYNDTRFLYLSGSASQYPYTIVYEVSYVQKFSYGLPDWDILGDYNVSLQKGSLQVVTPIDYKLNYRENNISIDLNLSSRNNSKVYLWELNGLHAINYEPYSPPKSTFFPEIKLSPSDFAYENYKGSMENWKEFGRFRLQLIDGLSDELSDETKNDLFEITKDCTSDLCKAQAVYHYMQNKTRYVNISEGIGGIQPFDAKVVEKYGYGDCKALSNYMMALLKGVGIQSNYSIIKAGRGAYWFDTTFVEHFSNHVILYVPVDEKDIWLECTSQIIPFGFLGDFTDDRFALVITESGGILKKTTHYGLEQNRICRTAHVRINQDGSGHAEVKTHYTGMEYDQILPLIHEDYEAQKDYLYEKHIDIPDFKINSFSFTDYPDIMPRATENLDLELINYASASGSRLFIPLNLMNRFEDIPRNERERVNPIEIFQEFSSCDTVIFQIPEGYKIEYLPEEEEIEYDFGKLVYSVVKEDENIKYIRKFELYRNRYPKEKYPDFANFCRDMKKADKVKVILVRL